MNKPILISQQDQLQQLDQQDFFYESNDRLLSLSSSCSCSNSNSDQEDEDQENNISNYNFALNSYDIWISQPSSVSERRTRLLQTIGLSSDFALSRGNPIPPYNAIFRSKSDGHNNNSNNSCFISSSSSTLNVNSSVLGNSGGSPAKPPSGKNSSRRSHSGVDFLPCNSSSLPDTVVSGDALVFREIECDEIQRGEEQSCTIRDLDNGKEFVVKEVREDGMWNKVKEVGTGRQSCQAWGWGHPSLRK